MLAHGLGQRQEAALGVVPGVCVQLLVVRVQGLGRREGEDGSYVQFSMHVYMHTCVYVHSSICSCICMCIYMGLCVNELCMCNRVLTNLP